VCTWATITTHMSKPRSKQSALWAIVGIVIIFALLRTRLGDGLAILLLAGGVITIIGIARWFDYRARTRANQQRQARLATIRKTVEQHKRVLLRKQKQGTFYDEYDMADDTKWQTDLRYFVRRVLPAKVSPEDLIDYQDIASRCALVQSLLAEMAAEEDLFEDARPKPAIKPSTHSVGIAFENECAEVLRQAGWKARATVASGDQGVDIEAERDGFTIVVQCKHYAAPVGNGAVQEIAAGALHYGANRGVVVSKSSYTPAARRLAHTTGVLLVDFDDLKYIDILLDDGRPEGARVPVSYP
jgi:restriction system protein